MNKSIVDQVFEYYDEYKDLRCYCNLKYILSNDGGIQNTESACFGNFNTILKISYFNHGGINKLAYTIRQFSLSDFTIIYDALFDEIKEFCKDIFDIELQHKENFTSIIFTKKYEGNFELDLAIFVAILSVIRYMDKEQEEYVEMFLARSKTPITISSLAELLPFMLNVRKLHAHNLHSGICEAFKFYPGVTSDYLLEVRKAFTQEFVTNADVLLFFENNKIGRNSAFPGQSYIINQIFFSLRSLGWM